MLYAIKARGVGETVELRAIEPSWPLVDGESSAVEIDDEHSRPGSVVVLGPDGATVTIRAADVASTADVKAEAARRIEAILPDYKQRNVLAFGLETMMVYGSDPAEWPAPLQAVNTDMQAKWNAIKEIRVRSDEIEAMRPIPADFRNDSYWPAA